MSTERFSNYSVILVTFLLFCLLGCGIIPKRVEFFQDKVEPVPEKSAVAKERERQAAELVNRRVNEAKSAAVEQHSSTNIIIPLVEASIVSDALKLSLGPPKKIWSDDSEELAQSIRLELSKLNKKIEDYRADTQKNIGKSIEGTGWFSMSYITYIGVIAGGLFVLSLAIKIYGMVNPVVGLAGNAAKIPVKLLATGFKQVLSAGENFKEAIDKKIDDPATKELVLELFRGSHEKSQDENIKTIIKDLTRKV